eukprot:11136146-Alexandrium_andersonii.AAC.1
MGPNAPLRSARPPPGGAMPVGPPRLGRPARPPLKEACSFALGGRFAPGVCPTLSENMALGRGSPTVAGAGKGARAA